MDNKETFDTWNKIASLYEEKFMTLDLYNASYDFFCDEIKVRNPEVLEVGCGPGNITRYMLHRRPDFNILGTDISPNMIALAQKNNPTASFEIMDARSVGEIHTEFDGIISGFCLPYLSFEESEKFISDSNRLLRANGLLYLSFMEGDPVRSGFLTGSSGDRVYFYYHEMKVLEACLSKNRFQELKVFRVEYERGPDDKEYHTVVVAKKV